MQKLTLQRDGIHGYYHQAATPYDSDKAVIVVGGSEGKALVPLNVSGLFADDGISSLGLCYWSMPGLPDNLVEIPLEAMERAVHWLRERGHTKIAIYGWSKGAEFSLLSASLMPDITCVIAVAPSFVSWAGLKGGRSALRKGFTEAPSFTWRGMPLPYVQGKKDTLGILARLITQRQVNMRFMYERALEALNPDAIIRVETIMGPVLLQAPDDDSMWPSRYSGERIMARLGQYGFSHPRRFTRYTCSHMLTPVTSPLRKVFQIERKRPGQCDESRKAAFAEANQWLKEW